MPRESPTGTEQVTLPAFLQQCVLGLTSGGFLGLIAVGYTLVYGTVGLIHFAHGDVVMLGGCLAVGLLSLLAPFAFDPLVGWLMIVLVTIGCGFFCGGLNMAIDRLVYRPLRQAPPLAPLVSAVGVSFILMNVGLLWLGSTDQAFPDLVTNAGSPALRSPVTMADLVVLSLVFPALIGLAILLQRTRFGRSLRSVAAVSRVTTPTGGADQFISATFFLGGFLGGVASVAASIHTATINYQMGYQTGLYALAAAVLGGIGSVPGAIVGGLLVGLIRAFSTVVLGPRWAAAAVFLVLIVILAFRPEGLFGQKRRERRPA